MIKKMKELVTGGGDASFGINHIVYEFDLYNCLVAYGIM